MKLSTPIRFFFPAKSPDSIGPGSISSLEDFLSQATLGAERAVARVRLLVAGLVVAWFVVEDPNLAHWAPKDWIRVGVISIAALFSIYTLRALRRGVRAEQVLVLSVLFDPIGIGVVLLTGVVFGGPYEQGILRSFDLSTFVLSTLAAGARLSTRVARIGIASNATVFVGLILIDRVLHAYAPWRWVLLSGLLAAIIYSGCCFFAYELARRTRRLVIEGARSIVMAERAQSHLRTYLPEEVADAALETPKPSIGGERRDVAVLFSDLRGFTSYAESLPPEILVAELNAYLEAMLEASAVGEHGVERRGVDDLLRGLPHPGELRAELRVGGESGIGLPDRHRLVEAPPVEVRVDRAHEVGDERELLVVGLGPVEATLLVLDEPVERHVGHVDQLPHSHSSSLPTERPRA